MSVSALGRVDAEHADPELAGGGLDVALDLLQRKAIISGFVPVGLAAEGVKIKSDFVRAVAPIGPLGTGDALHAALTAYPPDEAACPVAPKPPRAAVAMPVLPPERPVVAEAVEVDDRWPNQPEPEDDEPPGPRRYWQGWGVCAAAGGWEAALAGEAQSVRCGLSA